VTLPIGPEALAAGALVVAAGYLIFACTGFGASLVTVPVLAHFLPVPFVLAVSVLLDVGASLAIEARFRRDAERIELLWLAPFAILGNILGVTLLVGLPRRASLGGLGAFCLAYGLWSLARGGRPRVVSRAWAPAAGLAGGVTGALFGSGGPPYVIYLSRRLADPVRLRATISGMILLSTGMRLLVFAGSGLVWRDQLLAFALLVPFALLGLWAGTRLSRRLAPARLVQLVRVLVLATGASLLWRVAAGG
jgi:uncharacterized membrane protein YfcA